MLLDGISTDWEKNSGSNAAQRTLSQNTSSNLLVYSIFGWYSMKQCGFMEVKCHELWNILGGNQDAYSRLAGEIKKADKHGNRTLLGQQCIYMFTCALRGKP